MVSVNSHQEGSWLHQKPKQNDEVSLRIFTEYSLHHLDSKPSLVVCDKNRWANS